MADTTADKASKAAQPSTKPSNATAASEAVPPIPLARRKPSKTARTAKTASGKTARQKAEPKKAKPQTAKSKATASPKGATKKTAPKKPVVKTPVARTPAVKTPVAKTPAAKPAPSKAATPKRAASTKVTAGSAPKPAPKAASAKTAPKAKTKSKAKPKVQAKVKSQAAPKTPAPKTPAKAKLEAKAQAKPGAASKAAPKTASKPAPKAAPKTAPKSAAKSTPKTPPRAKTAPAPRTVRELHGLLDRTSARLGRADSRLRNDLKTLRGAIEALDARAKADDKAQTAALARRIRQVRSDLSTLSVETRAAVRTDLKSALNADAATRLEDVLVRVDAKIEASEAERARLLSRLNGHLATLARTVDARFVDIEAAQERETQSRRDAVDQLTARLDGMETDTARAVTDLGERVVSLATSLRADIEAARKGPGEALSDKLDTIAASTQEEVEALRASVITRLDAAERATTDARDAGLEAARRHDGSVASLTARLDSLEYALSQIQIGHPDGLQAGSQVAPQNTPQADNILALGAAAVQPTPRPVAQPTPAAEPAASDSSSSYRPNHFPVEYVPPAADPAPAPQPFAPDAHAAPGQPLTPHPSMLHPSAPQPSAPHPTAQDLNPATVQAASTLSPMPYVPQPEPELLAMAATQADPAPLGGATGAPAVPDFAPVPALDPTITPDVSDADLPYLNPGYAETGARPGGYEGDKPSILSRLPGRGKLLGAVAAIAFVGIAGSRLIANGGANVQLPEPDTSRLAAINSGETLAESPETGLAEGVDMASVDMASVDGAVPGTALAETVAPPALPTTPPIGDTSQLDVAEVLPGSPQSAELDRAVAAGNPIALYQKGLMETDRGRLDAGISLVRRAADLGLAPAQYRLAKFYEAGQGVPRDMSTAFRLTDMAARSGNRIAMHDLALMIAEGHGGPSRKPEESLVWFERAARLGVLDSQFNMAYLLDSGNTANVSRDPVAAYAWYAIAANNGDQQAKTRVAQMQTELSSEQLADAESRLAAFALIPLDPEANGIFEDLPWAPPTRVAALDRDRVAEVQSLLNQLGFDSGTPDGQAGPRTREAIAAYERARALPETGTPSAALLKALQSDAQA